MSRRIRCRIGLVAASLAGALVLSGCGFSGIYDVPLPGGPPTPNSYQVVVQFEDVTNLVPETAVKVNNVAVGTVQTIEPAGRGGNWHARVTLEIAGDVRLPDNAVARIAQTSVLGSKYVALSAPTDEPPRGRLTDGEVIPLSRTGAFPEVETVLTALSMLLNHGGLAQIQTITSELNAVLEGRESSIRDLLSDLNTFVGSLEEQKKRIVSALEGLNRLSERLAEQKEILADALDKIPHALEILNAQQEDLTRLLVALSDFGRVATRVIKQSREDLLANLRALEPILARLADAAKDIPNTVGFLVNFPFPDSAPNAIYGDYVNLSVTVDGSLAHLLNNLLPGPAGGGPLGQLVPPAGDASSGPESGPRNDGSGRDDDGAGRGNEGDAPSPTRQTAPDRTRPQPPAQRPAAGNEGLLELMTGGLL